MPTCRWFDPGEQPWRLWLLTPTGSGSRSGATSSIKPVAPTRRDRFVFVVTRSSSRASRRRRTPQGYASELGCYLPNAYAV